MPAYSNFTIELDYYWNGIEDYTDEEIREKIRELKKQVKALEDQFMSNVWTPTIRKLAEKAVINRDAILSIKLEGSEYSDAEETVKFAKT